VFNSQRELSFFYFQLSNVCSVVFMIIFSNFSISANDLVFLYFSGGAN